MACSMVAWTVDLSVLKKAECLAGLKDDRMVETLAVQTVVLMVDVMVLMLVEQTVLLSVDCLAVLSVYLKV